MTARIQTATEPLSERPARRTEMPCAPNPLTVQGGSYGSQYEAQSMAKQGTTYRDILSHYYPGAELKKA